MHAWVNESELYCASQQQTTPLAALMFQVPGSQFRVPVVPGSWFWFSVPGSGFQVRGANRNKEP